MLLKVAFSLLAAVLVASAERCCDPGWERTPEHTRCVQVSAQPMVWDGAMSACKALGASLLAIHSSFENAFIWHLATRAPNVTFGVWMGGHTNTPAAHQTTGWTWVSGEPWNYANWQTGKPDNWQGCHGLGFADDNQQCLEMWVWHGGDPDSANVSYWNDQCCHRPLNFICEKPTVEKPHC